MHSHHPNLLAIAIKKNSTHKVKKLLKKKFKLETEDLYDAFIEPFKINTTNPKIIDLLGRYQAFPADVSVATAGQINRKWRDLSGKKVQSCDKSLYLEIRYEYRNSCIARPCCPRRHMLWVWF